MVGRPHHRSGIDNGQETAQQIGGQIDRHGTPVLVTNSCGMIYSLYHIVFSIDKFLEDVKLGAKPRNHNDRAGYEPAPGGTSRRAPVSFNAVLGRLAPCQRRLFAVQERR
jgi:hypothetical protein